MTLAVPRDARVAWHAAKSLAGERVRARFESRAGPASRETLHQLFSAHNADVAFVHAGLRDVDAALDGDPYEVLLGTLRAHYDSVLVAGFTPAFLDSGVYHERYSRPEFGAFARLFLEDADYRTDDAVYSILVAGDYRFEGCRHDRSFGPRGCWAQLDRDDVLFVNVGTDGFRCSHLHYVEQRADVPYVTESEHAGVRIDEEGTERVVQRCPTDDYYRRYNRDKLQGVLADAGALDAYDCNGLAVRFCTARDVRTVLDDRLADDPYYLVT